jgi:ATP-dependent Lon protease
MSPELPESLERALVDVPVFPLPQAVLFPRAMMPLHIFEPRYRAMLAHCMATHRLLVVASIANPTDVDAEGQPRFASVAGLGGIVEHQPLPDGRSNILLHGLARVALQEIPSSDPFRRARATVLPDLAGAVAAADRAALLSAATSFAGELHKHAELSFTLPDGADTPVIADVCAHHLIFDATTRQALLEERDVTARVRRVTAELALQMRALQRRDGEAPGAASKKRSLLN